MLPLFITIQAFFTDTFERIEREQKGATAVEYGLLVGLVAIVVVVALVGLQEPLADLVDRIGGVIDGAAAAPAGG
ncbi:UNVERIFIED_CONTAM: Flp family type IVb pilin [Kocuria sp. CPCC 205274]